MVLAVLKGKVNYAARSACLRFRPLYPHRLGSLLSLPFLFVVVNLSELGIVLAVSNGRS
jgi:hypothetical protein